MRIHNSPPVSHADQNGSVRVFAVESMTKRASGTLCPHRAQGSDHLIEETVGPLHRPRSKPSTVSPRIHSSLPGSASTREPVSQFEAIGYCSLESAWHRLLRTKSRTLRSRFGTLPLSRARDHRERAGLEQQQYAPWPSRSNGGFANLPRRQDQNIPSTARGTLRNSFLPCPWRDTKHVSHPQGRIEHGRQLHGVLFMIFLQ